MLVNAPNIVNGLWVVEWSPRQKQFHIATVDEMLEINSRVFERQSDSDFLPIAICLTVSDAQTVRNQAEQILKNKD
jgi:hypothetical protein